MHHGFAAPLLAAMALLLAGADPAAAQHDPERIFQNDRVTVTAALAGAAYGDFQHGEVRIGQPLEGREVDRRLSAQTSLALSGAVSYWPSRLWGVRLHASYSPTRFRLISRESASQGRPEGEHPRLDVWLYDLDVMFRTPIVFGRVAPYGILGIGRAEYRAAGAAEEIPPEARHVFEAGGGYGAFGGVIGIGAAIPLERRDLFLGFEMTNHVTRRMGRMPRTAAEDEREVVELDPEGVHDGDAARGFTSHLQLRVGLAIPIRIAG